MKTALVYSERYLEHDLGRGHPERPERLRAIVELLKQNKLWNTPETPVVTPSPATVEDIRLVHDQEYISLFEQLCKTGAPIDGDTPTHKKAYEIALFSAGGAIKAGQLVMSGEARNAFGLLRPPGHHASRSRGGGFCYFNNIAIMTRRMQRDFGISRVLILDFDAHHGNGTQDIFYDDKSVVYISFHQYPLYPGTGTVDETGAWNAEGYNVNVPMPQGSGDEEYAAAIKDIFNPICEKFKPQLIAVSAGFDAHAMDPLTGLELSSEAFGWMAQAALDAADRACGGKVVFLLEGGYDLRFLAASVQNVIRAMRGEKFKMPERTAKLEVIDELKEALKGKWDL